MQQAGAPPAQLQQDLAARLAHDATELATAGDAMTDEAASSSSQLEPKQLAHVTSKLKNKYKLLPKDMLGATPTGVNMSLLAYAGPYGAIGQSIREPLQSAQAALKLTAEMAAEQARVQRAAAALAQRKAVAARAAEEALEHGQGPKGPKQKRLPSAAFRSQSRQQAQRPSSAHNTTNQKVGPGWYHVRHTAIDKHAQSALVKSAISGSSRPSSATAAPGRAAQSNLQRRPSIRSTAATLSTDGAASEAPTPSPRNRPNTAPSSPLARTGTTMTLQSPSLGKTLGRTTTAAFDPAFFGKTLGRSETNLTAAMFSKTLGRTSTNVVSYGKTLGRSGTMMSGMTMGRTMGREHGFGETMRHDFGATQAAAPPLAIDPLLTAMLQKAGTDMPQAKARATSPAFEAVGRNVDALDKAQQQPSGKLPKQISLDRQHDAVRKNLHLVVPFKLQVNLRDSSAMQQGKAHLVPGMHFQQPPPTYTGQHLKAGHPESLQHLDFCKQTPRPTVPPQTLAEQEEEEELDKAPDDARLEQQRSPLMSATIQHNTNRRRTVSAWEGRRHRFKPGSASKQRPASATSAKACLDTWTPLKTWMVACLDKQIPTSKTAAILGKEEDAADWQQWTTEQASLESCTSLAPPASSPALKAGRPASAQLHRQLPHRSKAQRPASAAAYLRLTAKMPFPAHKQPSARARSRNSPEPAQADALGSMLVSIAESAAALGDNRLPNAVDKSCHDKGNFGNATGEVDEQADCCGDSSGHLIADLSAVDLALDSHGHHAKHSRQSSHSAAPLTAADFSFDSQAGQPMRSHSPTDNSSSWALGSDVEAPQDAALQQSGPTSLVNAGRGHSAALQMPQPTSSIRHTRPQSAAVQMSAAAALSRPASAQPLAKSPGTFLRHARPQSAAATNVAAHGGLKALWREGQRRYGNRPISASQAGQSQNHVPGGTMSHTSRQEALHSMRPLKPGQGPTAPVMEAYWNAKYDPKEEVQGHRVRAPSWSLPPNRAIPQWRGTVTGRQSKQQAVGKASLQQQEWQKWVQHAAMSLQKRTE